VANLIIFISKNGEKALKIHKIFMFYSPFSGKKKSKVAKICPEQNTTSNRLNQTFLTIVVGIWHIYINNKFLIRVRFPGETGSLLEEEIVGPIESQ
jgi:hypothetical protein